jgi:DNA-binding beta-propeller fold protein YncE
MRTHIMHVVGAAAVTGTLTLLGLAGAGAAVVPASAARPAHPVTAYVVNFNNGSGTVTPIRTATNTALKPVKVGSGPVAIAITP